MSIRIIRADASTLEAYGEIPITFEVASRMRVIERNGRADLVEEPVEVPWVKDYDRDAGPPTRLRERWDLSKWAVLAACEGDARVGGAIVAWSTEGVDVLAVLWDLRVRPDRRREGIGTLLCAAAASWAASRGCVRLDVETQDVNVAACRFYGRRGLTLRAVDAHAYPELPGETQLIWSLPLTPPAGVDPRILGA